MPISSLSVLVALTPAALGTTGDCGEQKLVPAGLAPSSLLGARVCVDGQRLAATAVNANDAAGGVYVWLQDPPAWSPSGVVSPAKPHPNLGFGYGLGWLTESLLVGVIDRNESGFLAVMTPAGDGWALTETVAPIGVADEAHFGSSIGVSGNQVAVGAPSDTRDFDGADTGAVYLFNVAAGGWASPQKLSPSDGQSNDRFGDTLAFDGATLVVGAFGADPVGNGSGAAYAYRITGTRTSEQKLVASDAQANSEFGRAVAIGDDVIVVGATRAQVDGIVAGAAYVYRWNGRVWVEEQKLTAGDPGSDDGFGSAVAIGADWIAVASPADSNANGINAGSVYLFRNIAGAWVEDRKLLASDGTDYAVFGAGISADGELLAVGAMQDPGAGTGAGAIYVYNLALGCSASDLNADAKVNAADLSILLGFWGPCAGGCLGDIDHSGAVDSADLAIVLGDWTG